MLEMPVFFVSSNIPLGPHKLRSQSSGTGTKKLSKNLKGQKWHR